MIPESFVQPSVPFCSMTLCAFKLCTHQVLQCRKLLFCADLSSAVCQYRVIASSLQPVLMLAASLERLAMLFLLSSFSVLPSLYYFVSTHQHVLHSYRTQITVNPLPGKHAASKS